MIKIAHLITDLDTGGAEMMLYKLLTRMDRARFENIVVSLIGRGTLAERIEDLGVMVHSMGMKPGRISFYRFLRLVRLLRNLRPDIIQGWMYHGNLSAQLSAIFLPAKIPVLWNIRGDHTDLGSEKFLTALTIWLGARLSRLPAKIINNSQTSALSHKQKLGYCNVNLVIILNGFDTDLFTPSSDARIRFRSELKLREETLLIGLVGRYHPMKDHANFLRAAALLLKTYPDVHFVLVGKDVDFSNAELMEKIRALRLTGAVHLLGMRSDLSYVTAAFDIASSASSFAEGFPNVIGEAMSCGVPCVVTGVADSADIVGDTGIVVPPRDPNSLANAWARIIAMSADERNALGLAARERIVTFFSIEKVVRQYEKLYSEIVRES